MEQLVVSSLDIIKNMTSLGNGITRGSYPLVRYGGFIQLVNIETNPQLTEQNLEDM